MVEAVAPAADFLSFSADRGVARAAHQPSRMEATAPLVLVVDDNTDARVLYSEFLAQSGFRVITAAGGEDAVQLAKTEWPAAIVMDLSMPRMDGWEAIKQLRADPITADIPVVAVSAHAFGHERQWARELGADMCLSKPCLPPQVARVVRAMIAAGPRPAH